MAIRAAVVAVGSVIADKSAGAALRPLIAGVPKTVGVNLALKLPTTVPPPLLELACAPETAGLLGFTNPSTVNAVRSLSERSTIGALNAVSIGVDTAAD
jgi:hypothetical protein